MFIEFWVYLIPKLLYNFRTGLQNIKYWVGKYILFTVIPLQKLDLYLKMHHNTIVKEIVFFQYFMMLLYH